MDVITEFCSGLTIAKRITNFSEETQKHSSGPRRSARMNGAVLGPE